MKPAFREALAKAFLARLLAIGVRVIRMDAERQSGAASVGGLIFVLVNQIKTALSRVPTKETAPAGVVRG